MPKINENSSKPVFIKCFYNETQLSTATGFRVNKNGKNFLITNWHVVSGRHLITHECLSKTAAVPNKLVLNYRVQTQNGNYKWKEKIINLYDDNENHLWIEHPEFGSNVDVVAIKLENYCDFEESFDIDSNYELFVTEQVFILGFPYGFTVNTPSEPYAIWTGGTIASDPELELTINEKKLPVFLIDSKTREGQSGSPVIYYSENGINRCEDEELGRGISLSIRPFKKEIGIYSGRINKDSDLGYVWKWEIIRDILNKY